MNSIYCFLDVFGRIKGEFGFITADDVYHVTEYETDEDGNFKIISMKNIKLLPDQQGDTKKFASTTLRPFTAKPTTQNSFSDSCANCKLQPTKKPGNEIQKGINQRTFFETSTIPPPFKIVSKKAAETTLQPQIFNQNSPQTQQKINFGGNNQNSQDPRRNFNQNQQLNRVANEKLPKAPSSELPKFTSAFNNFPSESFNQPPQQNLQDPNDLLYRFNYDLDFNGHKEEGDQSGNKFGECYSVGPDNTKRIVSYTANEFGFMPQIRREPISLNEYDETNNKLRDYNFEWFQPTHSIFG